MVFFGASLQATKASRFAPCGVVNYLASILRSRAVSLKGEDLSNCCKNIPKLIMSPQRYRFRSDIFVFSNSVLRKPDERLCYYIDEFVKI